MYAKTAYGFVSAWPQTEKAKNDYFFVRGVPSENWQHWQTMLDMFTCVDCEKAHGKIYPQGEAVFPEPPLHPSCRCDIVTTTAIEAGRGTKDGENGADWWLTHYRMLPAYYITEDEIKALGWRSGKSPNLSAPKKMIAKGIYGNDNHHLPEVPGRIWYEADLNYYEGKRNGHRVLWSNDGLIFTTYDHYYTFHEII